jgi:hypothetical protein
MPAKKKYKVSEDGVLRDATDEEAANLELIQRDNTPTPEAN